MAYENVRSKFEAMGARAVVSVDERRRRAFRGLDRDVDYTIDVNEGHKRGETFEVFISPEAADNVEITVPNIDKKARHMLLAVRNRGEYCQYLCGHDERHWFVAALPRNVGNVAQAMAALMPDEATVSQISHRVRRKNRNKRRNRGFTRQGEWFFIPAPELASREDLVVLGDESLQRGGGKPHMAQFLCRVGGDVVYVNYRHPSGLTEHGYRRAVSDGGESPATFRQARRDATVYVRGRISHPDHKTVVLDGWCRVVVNTETSSSWRPEMRFID